MIRKESSSKSEQKKCYLRTFYWMVDCFWMSNYISKFPKFYIHPHSMTRLLILLKPIFHELSFGKKFISSVVEKYSATLWKNIFTHPELVYQLLMHENST